MPLRGGGKGEVKWKVGWQIRRPTAKTVHGGKLTQQTLTTTTETDRETTTTTETLCFTYGAEGTPSTVTYNGTTYYYATNLQGDVIAILDSTGTAVVTYTYDAWGKLLSTDGTMAYTLGAVNPLRYRGYTYEAESNLYYLQSRVYNPDLRRFISPDAYASTGQGILGNNMFAYCLNNPVRYVDYSGKFAIEITVTTAGLVVGVVICGIALAHFAAKAITTFLDWLSKQWYYSFAQITYEAAEVEPPDVTYPGDDAKKAPEGYEWRGNDEQGGKKGGYANPNGKDSWHPDLDHPDGIDPHWDYNDGLGHKWRVFQNYILQIK